MKVSFAPPLVSSSHSLSTTSSCFPATSLSQMNTKAVRLLCEGHSDQALAILADCLARTKQHLELFKKANDAASAVTVSTPDNGSNDENTQSTNIIAMEPQLALTEIPIDGAVGEDVYDAQERDTSFCLYRFALLTSPIEPLSASNDQDLMLWAQQEQENHAKHSTHSRAMAVHQDLTIVPARHHHQQQEEEQEEVFEEPWHANTIYTFCAVLTFNLGVVFHELGLSEGKLPYVSKARDLYKVGLTILGRKPSEYISDTVHAWLSCALHNNIGHVAAFLGDTIGTRQARLGLHRNLRHAQHAPSASLFQSSHARAIPGVEVGPTAAAA